MTINRISELESLIEFHDEAYWIHNAPIISDAKYDEYVNELKSLDPNNRLVNKVHSSISSSTSVNNKVIHKTPMLSLFKVYNDDDLFKWIDKVSRSNKELFSLEPKFDGLSADYTDMVLSTRGDDGIHGENISSKIKIINIEHLNYDEPLENITDNVRGEVIIKNDVFKKYKTIILRDDGNQYKYPRAMVAGLLNRDDVNLNNDKVLTFIDFNKFAMQKTAEQLKSLDWLSLLTNIKNWEYPTDGLVIKLVDTVYSNSLGFTSHHPKGQIAYKASNPFGTAKLLNVIWSPGKGKLTPVGIISPVIIAGANITKVSLHNAKNIIDKDIKINDELTIERAGEIIPYVTHVKPALDRIDISISRCPDCGELLVYSIPELRCVNTECYGMVLKTLTDTVSRIGFEYLAEATIEKLINIGIGNLIDILNLSIDDISQLDGFAYKSTMKLYDEIQRIKNEPLPDWKFVASLNMKGIGNRLSKIILNEINLSELNIATVDQLMNIESIGIERAIEIVEFFQKKQKYICDLLSYFTIIETKNSLSTTMKVICFTGKSTTPRNELIKIAEAKGYSTINSITSDVVILVTDSLTSTSSKMEKARKKSTIKIITYDEFYKMQP